MTTYRIIKKDELNSFRSLLTDFCIETDTDDDALSLMLGRVETGTTTIIAAEDEYGVCGLVGFMVIGIRCFPDFFYVIPERRGGVVGGTLYKKCIETAKAMGAKLLLPMVTDDKIDMYTKLGFRRKLTILEKEI